MEIEKPIDNKDKLRIGLIVLTSVSLVLCPLAWGSQATTQVAFAGQPFSTLVPVQATFTPPIGSPIPTTIPIPTLGPGQYFEQGDPRLPDEIDIEKGDEQFGYGPLNDEETLYLMWYTDENGTHYRVVDNTSQVLFGSVDPITGERRDNGFDKKVEQREKLKGELSDLNVALRGEERAVNRSYGFSALLLGVGLGICILASAGLCTLATPIVAAGALAGMGFGIENSSDYATVSDQIDAKVTGIEGVESDLGFDLSRPEPPLPGS